MWVELSKILPYLLYPLSICLMLWILAFLLTLFRHGRPAKALAFVATLFLLLSSLPPVAATLWSSLERQYPVLPISVIEPAGAIVILGGGINIPQAPRLEVELNGSGDRLLFGLKLFQHGKAPYIVLTGGNVFHQPGFAGESEYSSRFLQQRGVAEAHILLDSSSRNTYENAIQTRNLLAKKNIRQIILVTSAFHMPRSAGVFRQAGFDVIAAPTDIRITDSEQPELLNWLPSASALDLLTGAWREYLGIAVYRLRGWL